jgi:hypothetical protein
MACWPKKGLGSNGGTEIQIFVSSVQKDLQGSVGSEDYISRSVSSSVISDVFLFVDPCPPLIASRRHLLAEVEQRDIYLGILGSVWEKG